MNYWVIAIEILSNQYHRANSIKHFCVESILVRSNEGPCNFPRDIIKKNIVIFEKSSYQERILHCFQTRHKTSLQTRNLFYFNKEIHVRPIPRGEHSDIMNKTFFSRTTAPSSMKFCTKNRLGFYNELKPISLKKKRSYFLEPTSWYSL